MATYARYYRVKCKYCAKILLKSHRLPGNMRLLRDGYPDILRLSWSGERSTFFHWGEEAHATWLESVFRIRDIDSYGPIVLGKVKCKNCSETFGVIRVYKIDATKMRAKVIFEDPGEKVALEERVELVGA